MITFFRWLIGTFFILAVSIFLLILALPVLYNPNDYKPFITNLVREKTGRELVVDGSIQVQISPWLNATCTLGQARLASNTLYPNTAWIESEQTKIELSLWSLLLQRRLNMTSIMLDGATLNLLRNKDGISNWQLLANPPATAKEESTAPPITDNSQIQRRIVQFFPNVTGIDLGKLQLTDINVRYNNRQTNKLIVLNDLELKTGRIQEKIPFPFEAGCNLTLDDDKAAMLRSGEMTMQGNATLFMQEPHLLLEDLRMEGVIKGKHLPKRGLKILFATNSDIQLQQQHIAIKDFSLIHEEITLRGSGTVDDFSSPRFDLSLKIPDCSPQPLLKQLKIALPNWQDPDILTHFNGELRVKGDGEMVEMTDLTLTVDDTTASGTIKIMRDTSRAYDAVIHLNRLDLDRYALKKTSAPPISEEQPPASMADEEQAEPFLPLLPANLLKTLFLQLELQLDSLKMGGIELTKVQMMMDGKDGIIELAPFTASLYEGNIKLETRLDATGDVPQLQVKSKINKVQSAPLFQNMTGSENITGTARLEADLKSSGRSGKEILAHLNGAMRLELMGGMIRPINILQVIQRADALYRDETPPPMIGDAATEFNRLNGSAIFENGVLRFDDLMATSELMQITGAGKIDLVGLQADIMLNVSLTPGLGKEAMGLTDLYGKRIPYKIFGPITDLGQEADMEKILPLKPEEEPMKRSPKQAASQQSTPEKKEAHTPPVPKTRADAD